MDICNLYEQESKLISSKQITAKNVNKIRSSNLEHFAKWVLIQVYFQKYI